MPMILAARRTSSRLNSAYAGVADRLARVGALADRHEVRMHPDAVAQDDRGQLVAAVGVDGHRARGFGGDVGRVGIDAHDAHVVGTPCRLA